MKHGAFTPVVLKAVLYEGYRVTLEKAYQYFIVI